MSFRDKPDDAQILIDAQYYKIGRHGLIFVWRWDGWKRSSKPDWEVLEALGKYGDLSKNGNP